MEVVLNHLSALILQTKISGQLTFIVDIFVRVLVGLELSCHVSFASRLSLFHRINKWQLRVSACLFSVFHFVLLFLALFV